MLFRMRKCVVAFLLLSLIALTSAAPYFASEDSLAKLPSTIGKKRSSINPSNRFFKKARRKIKKTVKKQATKVGDVVKDQATKVGDRVKDLVGVTEKRLREVGDKVEKALDKACEKAGTSAECKTTGSLATFVGEAAVKGVVSKVRDLGDDFQAIADGDIVRAVDVFADLAPLVFPLVAVPHLLTFEVISTFVKFLKCGFPLAKTLGKDAVKQAPSMRPLAQRVIKCVKRQNVIDVLFTIADKKGDPRPVAQIIQKCIEGVRKEVKIKGYRTITVGAMGGGGRLEGLLTEGGIAFDIGNAPPKPVRGYLTVGSSAGLVLGGGAGLVVGFANVPHDELSGKGQGLAMGGGPFVVSAGLALDFIGNNQFTRVAFSAEVGLGSPVEVSCSSTLTEQF